MVQLNLVIDGNYLLYRAVFILHKLRTLYGDLETLLLNDYTNISNSYSFNAIYFISDSKVSWRKKLYTEYKGKRKKQEQIDWDFVFETFDNFKESIKSRHNCLTYQIDPFEGDDIIAHIVKKSNEEGMSNLIVSNAGDSGDNILSVIKITPKTMGIGDAGSNKVYNMYKEKYPEDIDFDSNVFVDRLGYILSIYKKNTNEEWIKKVKENIIKSRLLTRLDSKYLPDGFNEILNENIKI
jgi:hypothetical protein